MREGYKDSELGEIPYDWNVSNLEKVCLRKEGLRRGPFGGAIKKEFFVEDGYQVYEQRNAIYNDFKSARYFISASKFEELKAFQVQENDFIVSCSGTIGRIAKVPAYHKEGVINQALLRIRLNRAILIDDFFLHQFRFEPFQSKIIDSTQGGAMKNLVGMSEFRKTKILIPPLPEQQKIAKILSTVDDKIDVIDQLIIQTQELKKGLMQRLLTKGIGHTKFKDSPLGEIPESWEVGTFDQIARNVTTKFTEKEGKCIELEHIDQRTGRLLGYDNVFDKSSVKNHFKIGDILFCKLRPYLRKFWHCEFEGGCTSELLVIRSKQGGDSRFIYYTVQQDSFINHTVSSSYGTKMPRTSWKIITEYKLPIPSLIEQQKIADILSTVDGKLEVLQDKKQEYQELKKGLMQQLLTGKIRVAV